MTDTTPRRRARQAAQSTFTSRTSIGMKLLSAILANGATNVLRRCQEPMFTAEELPAWRAVDGYYRRLGTLPGPDALADMAVTLPEATDPVQHYFERANERWTYNVLLENSSRFNECLRNRQVYDAVDTLRTMQSTLPAQAGLRDLTTSGEELQSFLQNYESNRWRTGLRGVTTGYLPVDRETNGFLPGDVGVLVGRPGMGKSWCLIHMLAAAWRAGSSALVVSMEMTPQQLVSRLVSLEAGIDAKCVHQSRLSEWARRQMMATISGLGDRPPLHFVAGRFRKSVRDIEAYIAETSPDMVYIDGSYLISADTAGRYSSKHERISDVIEGIKEVAVNGQVPIMNTVQFNREVRRKTRGDLDLAQIAGSDSIGQIATLIAGLRQGPSGYEETRRVLELIKNREGELLKLVANFQFAPPDFTWREGEEPDARGPHIDENLTQGMV